MTAIEDIAIISNFTFILPYIIIDSFLNNQRDALIIQILFCYKTLTCFGQDATELVQLHSDSAWKLSSETGMNLTSAECTVENS